MVRLRLFLHVISFAHFVVGIGATDRQTLQNRLKSPETVVVALGGLASLLVSGPRGNLGVDKCLIHLFRQVNNTSLTQMTMITVFNI